MKVYRANTSPYQAKDFVANEKQALEKIPSISYSEIPDDCEILLTNTHTQIEKYANLPLKLLVHPNSGYDNFSKEFVENAPFPVIAGNPVRAQAVAQYILSALFEHSTTVPKHPIWNSQRLWPRKLLEEQNILIIGHGHIGKIVEETLWPLAPKIKIFDPYKKPESFLFDYQLETIDTVILSASLNPSSYHLLNNDFFHKLSKNALIINAARGALIEEQSLIQYLSNNPDAFAYLDVFENEPFNSESFAHLNNIVTSSHIAGVFSNIDQAIISFEAEIINSFINNDNFKERYKSLLLQNRIHGEFLI